MAEEKERAGKAWTCILLKEVIEYPPKFSKEVRMEKVFRFG